MDDDLLARLQAGETLPADGIDLVVADTFGSRTLGLVWDSLALDRITAHLDVDARHLQPYGLVHGGVWCSVVESTASFGAALHAAASGRRVVGVNNSTDFLRGVRDGRVDVVATPLHVGRLQQLWQVELTRATDDRLVARGQVRLQHLEPSPPPASPIPRRNVVTDTHHTPTVLFLCVHNAGRSQMAAGWLRHLAQDRVRVLSGGSEPGDAVNPTAVAAMEEVGIDIADAQPKPWTPETLEAADVVVTMGCGDTCPVLPGKRYVDWQLPDPAGKPLDEVRPVRDEIERRVRDLMEELDVEPARS